MYRYFSVDIGRVIIDNHYMNEARKPKRYRIYIEEMGEYIYVSARTPQQAYDLAEIESKAMFSPMPNFDELTIGVVEVAA